MNSQNPYEAPQPVAVKVETPDSKSSRSALRLAEEAAVKNFIHAIGPAWEHVCIGADKCLFAMRVVLYPTIFISVIGFIIFVFREGLKHHPLFITVLTLVALLVFVIVIPIAAGKQLEGIWKLAKADPQTGARGLLKGAFVLFAIYVLTGVIVNVYFFNDGVRQGMARSAQTTFSAKYSPNSATTIPNVIVLDMGLQFLSHIFYTILLHAGIFRIGKAINDREITNRSLLSLVLSVISILLSLVFAGDQLLAAPLLPRSTDPEKVKLFILMIDISLYLVALFNYAYALRIIAEYRGRQMYMNWIK